MSKWLLKLIPSSVRITSKVTYEIVFIEAFPDPKQVGECRLGEHKQIVIKSGQSPTETFLTCLHEISHSLSDEYGIGLTESQVLKLERALFNILKLNKLLPRK